MDLIVYFDPQVNMSKLKPPSLTFLNNYIEYWSLKNLFKCLIELNKILMINKFLFPY